MKNKLFLVLVVIAIALSACGPTIVVAPTLTSVPPTSVPVSTNTPQPTITPWPTSTPQLPTATPVPEVGTLSNPYPAGEKECFHTTGTDGTVNDACIQILAVVRGAKAWQTLYASNMFNTKAPDGMEYVLVEVKVTLISGTVNLTDADFAMVSDGQLFNGFSLTILDNGLAANLVLPTSTTGWIAKTVFIDDSHPLLVFGLSPFDNTISDGFFFAF